MRCKMEAMCLEVTRRPNKKPDGKEYINLMVFEFGKQYPDATQVSVSEAQLPSLKPLLERRCMLELDIHMGKFTSLSFISGNPIAGNKP